MTNFPFFFLFFVSEKLTFSVSSHHHNDDNNLRSSDLSFDKSYCVQKPKRSPLEPCRFLKIHKKKKKNLRTLVLVDFHGSV